MVVISESTIEHTLTIAIITATISWFLFIVLYSLTAKWWKTPVGRNTFGVSAVLFVILFRQMSLRVWPEVEQKDLIGIAVYSLATLFAFRRIWIMLFAQFGKSEPPPKKKVISRVH